MVIVRFHLQYEFLSNFYPCTVKYGVDEYPSAEHAFQAAKTYSAQWRARIHNSPTPAGAKKLGRQVPLRPNWDNIRIETMEQIIRSKFDNKNLRRLLLETGDALLIEGNTWGDDLWGVDLTSGQGQNELGKILMKVREELRIKERDACN